jgi:hypothetical protein
MALTGNMLGPSGSEGHAVGSGLCSNLWLMHIRGCQAQCTSANMGKVRSSCRGTLLLWMQLLAILVTFTFTKFYFKQNKSTNLDRRAGPYSVEARMRQETTAKNPMSRGSPLGLLFLGHLLLDIISKLTVTVTVGDRVLAQWLCSVTVPQQMFLCLKSFSEADFRNPKMAFQKC